MKLSAWHKRLEDTVTLVKMKDDCNLPLELFGADVVYASCIFSWSEKKVKLLEDFAKWRASKNPSGLSKILIGGSGYDLTNELADHIEHLMPDYSVYGIKYSVGFTSRGCDRNCPWCIIPKKEGRIRDHAPLGEFCVWHWRKVRLMDNNFLQSPKSYENLIELIAHKMKVDFNQGLDIRLVDQENAKLLAKCHYSDTNFRGPRLRFSFDLPQIEDQVLEGVGHLLKVGIKPSHLFFYILVGYNTDFEEDYHRFEVINKLGALPFIMIYNNRKDNKQLRDFARWVNQRHYKWVAWKDYDWNYRAKYRKTRSRPNFIQTLHQMS